VPAPVQSGEFSPAPLNKGAFLALTKGKAKILPCLLLAGVI